MKYLMLILASCLVLGLFSCADSGSDDSETVATPALSPSSYVGCTTSVPVTITSSTDGSSIYYEITDYQEDTTVDVSDTLYTGPVDISGSSSLHAIAIKDGMVNSSDVSGDYDTNNCALFSRSSL